MLKNVLTGQLKPIQINFEPADDQGGGSHIDALLADADFDSGDDEVAEKPALPPASVPAKESLAPKSDAIDYDAMASKFGEEVGKHLRPKDEPKPAMTEAERRALLKIWEPDDAWLEEFNTPAKQKAAISAMMERQREHQNLMLQATVRHLEEKFGAQLAPIQERTAAEQTKQLYSAFQSEYPTLADPKYADVVRFAAGELRGRNFKDQSEGFSALATLVEKTVKNFDPKFSLSGGPTGNNKPKTTDDSRKLPVQKSGAGGSGGRGEDKSGNSATDVISLLTKRT